MIILMKAFKFLRIKRNWGKKKFIDRKRLYFGNIGLFWDERRGHGD